MKLCGGIIDIVLLAVQPRAGPSAQGRMGGFTNGQALGKMGLFYQYV